MMRTRARRAAAFLRPGLWERLTRRGPDGERGAILVLASVATVVALAGTALAVDLGKMVATKRTLQSVVDTASLDAVQALGNKKGLANGLSTAQYVDKLARD